MLVVVVVVVLVVDGSWKMEHEIGNGVSVGGSIGGTDVD